MYHPTTRVLTVLEMLQSRQRLGGGEIAERLEVDKRTVRRYITMLQDLGIPIEAERGRYGGYRIRPGYKLPPLMFTDDEALAVVLGLIAARRLGLASAAPDVEGALAKIERVLPETLREHVWAVQEALQLDLVPAAMAPTNGTVVLISRAVRARRPVWLRYQRGQRQSSDGQDVTERMLNPYGVVYRAGRWYAIGHCQLRNDLRSFRLDRILRAEEREGSFTPPPGFDCVAFLLGALAMTPEEWEVELVLDTSLDEARHFVQPALAILDELSPGNGQLDAVRFRASVGNLDYLASELATYPFPITVVKPVELRDALRRRAAAILASAER